MKRTDAHCETNFDPAAYAFVATFYCGPNLDIAEAFNGRDAIAAREQYKEHGFNGNFARNGTCDHCGAWFDWGAFLKHIPSGELIAVGHICAETRFSLQSRDIFELQRAKRLRERAKTAAAAAKYLRTHPDIADAFHLFRPDDKRADRTYNPTEKALNTLVHIEESLKHFGTLTEKQAAYVVKLRALILEKHPKDKMEKAARDALLESVPDGDERITIRGKVVSTKIDYTQYGEQWKMLVQDIRGFRVYGSIPSSIYDAQRNDYVTFIARVKRSKSDRLFGFYSRPTSASFVAMAIDRRDG